MDLQRDKLDEYVGIYVHTTVGRVDRIEKVKKGVGFLHLNGQRDNAIYAKVTGDDHYRWYASFGGDYRPMTKTEMEEYL